jgi:hypothetical protein
LKQFQSRHFYVANIKPAKTRTLLQERGQARLSHYVLLGRADELTQVHD